MSTPAPYPSPAPTLEGHSAEYYTLATLLHNRPAYLSDRVNTIPHLKTRAEFDSATGNRYKGRAVRAHELGNLPTSHLLALIAFLAFGTDEQTAFVCSHWNPFEATSNELERRGLPALVEAGMVPLNYNQEEVQRATFYQHIHSGEVVTLADLFAGMFSGGSDVMPLAVFAHTYNHLPASTALVETAQRQLEKVEDEIARLHPSVQDGPELMELLNRRARLMATIADLRGMIYLQSTRPPRFIAA